MAMTLMRLADLSLYYAIKDTLVNEGWDVARFRIMDGYPNESQLQTGELWPTITVELDRMYGRDIEIGSKQWPAIFFEIDILANTDSQRDDISYQIYENMNEEYFNLYDFNSGFPSTVGDYSGITLLGEFYVDSLTVDPLPPVADTNLEGLKHHTLITGQMHLPNV